MPKHPHILNAASNLLGIALVLITGLRVARFSSFADEVAWVAAVMLVLSCLTSYLALRTDDDQRFERVADITFLSGLFALVIAVMIVALQSEV